MHVGIFALGALRAGTGEGGGSIGLWALGMVMSGRVIGVHWLFTDHGLGEMLATAIGMNSDFDTAAVLCFEVRRARC